MSENPPFPAAYPPRYQGAPIGYPPGASPPLVPRALTPPPRSARLGVIALILALVAAIAATALSAVNAFSAAARAMANGIEISPDGLENLSDSQLLALLSPVRGLVLWAEIGLWVGTLLGIWALVQGIVAIATRRGRGPGIAAVVVAAVGPVIFALFVGFAIATGIAVGAQGS